VKRIGFKKKNLIAMALVTVLAVSGLGVHNSQAAERVDLTKDITITATVSSESAYSIFASEYKGNVIIDLYKIASLDAAGTPTLTSEFANSGAKLSVLNGDKVVVDDVKKEIVEKVTKVVEDNKPTPTATITATKGENGLTNASTIIKSTEANPAAGIYLYVPRPTQDDYYDYNFTSYIIYAPTSDYIMGTGTSDAWNYDTISFALKAEATERYGALKIQKTLKSYNESLGEAAFAYDVEITKKDGTTKFLSNAYSMNFEAPGTQEIFISEMIPAGSTVTVTEYYVGASYKLTSSSYSYEVAGALGENAKTVIKAQDTLIASFTNEYNDEIDVGTISIENHFGEEGFIPEEETPVEVIPEQEMR